MFSHFFGHYLLEKKHITPGQLREVLALQDSVRVKIGILAIDAGYMTAAQVETVHRLQATFDMRFGEIAIGKGYLTEETLTDLLSRQSKRHLLVSQALADKGILTFERIEQALAAYRRDSGLCEAEFEALKKNDMDAVAAALARMPELGDPEVYAGYFALFVRNLVRFIDDGIAFKRAVRVAEQPFEHLVYQEMDGRFKLFTGLAGSGMAMAAFASRYARAGIPDWGDYARDALGEFLNVQNGLFLSKLSNDWVELELLPPESRSDRSIRSVGVVYAIPFTLPFGDFTFLIGLGSPVFN
ncbi:hypothetical protein [Desulfolutivibrio sulfoxidireducens]|uniref:hypothetical protein n=1 Tax=Desulfolutivibrio sulfoxidireducens TaxID=2773299 RepID=UPI00159E174C|nr:hypothetical protein [Desulfolutivibrio sulfoxidireducens]QLA16879.1 hypothetical protein GD605_12665 [Desulfolutivibrio sulfoxidireducens]QLA20445.1 hypothetical protein GD604_12375 [Desulfolutivibrio sulfoxidireducens]